MTRTIASLTLAIALAWQPAVADDAAADCLALALYFEARGEPTDGQRAVAAVIFNRVSDARFPSNVCAVVKDGGELPPCQFSWWCDGKSDRPRDRDAYAKLRTLAARWVANPPRDATGGALFFHARGMAEPWRVQRVRTAAIGSHVFYR